MTEYLFARTTDVDASAAIAAKLAAEAAQAAAELAKTDAETAQSLAETAQGLAEDARDAAEAAQLAAEIAADNFDDVYLGSKAVDPTLDNDGNPLVTGQLYWNTSSTQLKVYDGAAWQGYNPQPGIANLVEDTTPQLGGDLDFNGFAALSTVGGTPAGTFRNTNDTANAKVLALQGLSPTPAANDIIYMAFELYNNAGTPEITEYGRISVRATDLTDGSEDGEIIFGVMQNGTVTNELRLTLSALLPWTSDGLALGTTSAMWADLFLASGGVINFNNGDVTITHASNTLTFNGASSGYAFTGGPVVPATNDAAALGTTALMWSDLFLASGAVINFNNGDVTITHSANQLNFAGATTGYFFDAPTVINSSVYTSGASAAYYLHRRDTDAQAWALYSPGANLHFYDVAGTLDRLILTSTALVPGVNDALALGTTALMWSDLFLASGSVINWNNGDLTLTHSSNLLTLAGGNFSIGTSAVFTTGTIELGHASQNTLSAASGILSIEGTPIYKAGRESLYIPAAAWAPTITNGAARSYNELATNDIISETIDFDTTTQEFATCEIVLPNKWNASTLTFRVRWRATAGSAAQTVDMALSAVAISNDDAEDATLGTPVVVSDALIATGDHHVSPESTAVTIAGTPAKADKLVLKLQRNVSTDNLAADAMIEGVEIFWTSDAATDA